jgi:hypothetical protein
MNIFELKQYFDSNIQPDPLGSIAACDQAWNHFKKFLQLFPEGESCEEFGISFGFANINDGLTSWVDQELFQVYFGRLIDGEKDAGWCTAEIDFYYRFEMNEKLSALLAALPKEDVETAYCLAEGQSVIHKKQLEIIEYADAQVEIWEEIKKQTPKVADYHFWNW